MVMRDAIWWLRSRTWWWDDDFLHNEYFFKCWWGRSSKKCGLNITIDNYVADYDLFAMITMNICTLQISKSTFARCQQYGCCWRRRSRSHYFPILSGPSGEGCHIHTLPTLDDDQQDDGMDIISSSIYKLPHKSWKMDGHCPVNIRNATKRGQTK